MAVRTLSKNEDEYDIFGKFIASEFRNISSDHLRRKMKRKIQQIILEISEEAEEIMNNESPAPCDSPSTVSEKSEDSP